MSPHIFASIYAQIHVEECNQYSQKVSKMCMLHDVLTSIPMALAYNLPAGSASKTGNGVSAADSRDEQSGCSDITQGE